MFLEVRAYPTNSLLFKKITTVKLNLCNLIKIPHGFLSIALELF